MLRAFVSTLHALSSGASTCGCARIACIVRKTHEHIHGHMLGRERVSALGTQEQEDMKHAADRRCTVPPRARRPLPSHAGSL